MAPQLLSELGLKWSNSQTLRLHCGTWDEHTRSEVKHMYRARTLPAALLGTVVIMTPFRMSSADAFCPKVGGIPLYKEWRSPTVCVGRSDPACEHAFAAAVVAVARTMGPISDDLKRVDSALWTEGYKLNLDDEEVLDDYVVSELRGRSVGVPFRSKESNSALRFVSFFYNYARRGALRSTDVPFVFPPFDWMCAIETAAEGAFTEVSSEPQCDFEQPFYHPTPEQLQRRLVGLAAAAEAVATVPLPQSDCDDVNRASLVGSIQGVISQTAEEAEGVFLLQGRRPERGTKRALTIEEWRKRRDERWPDTPCVKNPSWPCAITLYHAAFAMLDPTEREKLKSDPRISDLDKEIERQAREREESGMEAYGAVLAFMFDKVLEAAGYASRGAHYVLFAFFNAIPGDTPVYSPAPPGPLDGVPLEQLVKDLANYYDALEWIVREQPLNPDTLVVIQTIQAAIDQIINELNNRSYNQRQRDRISGRGVGGRDGPRDRGDRGNRDPGGQDDDGYKPRDDDDRLDDDRDDRSPTEEPPPPEPPPDYDPPQEPIEPGGLP